MIELNDKAPEFTLKNTKKEDVSLSDFNDGPVVIAFYPGAFTGVCDTEMCTLQDNLKLFNDFDATVLGISVDHLGQIQDFLINTILNLIYCLI